MTDRDLLKQALEALEADEHDMVPDQEGHMVFRKESAIAALRERLAQPEQKPVAWGVFDGPNLHDTFFTEEDAQYMANLKGDGSVVQPLYIALRERLAQPNEFNPDWDAMAVMVEEQQRMATEIDSLRWRLKAVNTAAMNLTHELVCMEVDDDERLDRDRVMGRIMQWRNEWDKAMHNNPPVSGTYTTGVMAERQRIVNLLMIQHEAAKGAHNYWHVAAQLIQADIASDT